MKKLYTLITYVITLLLGSSCCALSLKSTQGYKTDSPLFANGDSICGFVSLKKGFQATGGDTITFDTDGTLSGPVKVHGDGPLTISLAGDLHLGSGFNLQTPLILRGHKTALVLGAALHLPASYPLNIDGETTINGMGHELSSEKAIKINDQAKLTLRNLTLSSTNDHLFDMEPTAQGVELNTVVLNVNGVQSLVNDFGNIVIHNKVTIQGSSDAKIILPANATLTIMPHATLCIEGVILSCENTSSENQIRFIDETSTINLNQSSFELLGNAIFTKGRITCNNEVILNVTAERSLIFGDGENKKNNFNLMLLGGTSVKLDGSGIIIDRSV